MAYNILIVDDSSPMRKIIKKIVMASHFNVGEYYEAADGVEALKILETQWLDIVITDFNMPNMNGLELVKEIRNRDTMSSIPVVMVTTEGSDKRVKEFMEQGVNDYIKKPFTPEEIKSKLMLVMGEKYEESGESTEGDDGLDF